MVSHGKFPTLGKIGASSKEGRQEGCSDSPVSGSWEKEGVVYRTGFQKVEPRAFWEGDFLQTPQEPSAHVLTVQSSFPSLAPFAHQAAL